MPAIFQTIYQELCQTLFRHTSFTAAAEPILRQFVPAYRAGLHRARILSITPQAGCLRLRLKVSRRFPAFVAGQHLQLHIEIDGRLLERTFSICSAEQRLSELHELELAIQIQPQGRFTGALSGRLRPGHNVYLSRPAGDFCLKRQQPACLVAAGSGVTPLFSMLKSISRLTQPMTFIYSFRGQTRQLFAEEWGALQAKFPLLRLVLWDSASQGRLTPALLLSRLQPDLQAQFYLCGPQQFTTDFSGALIDAGVAKTAIHSESFGVVVPAAGETQPVLLQLGHQIHQLGGHGSLLQRAEQAGLTLPYGCRRGVCMQCLCEKQSGVVRNLLTGELSDAGPGRIQLCISAAVSPVTVQSVEISV
jgi:ferredoxin-NADP reductase